MPDVVTSSDVDAIMTAANYAAIRTLLGLVIGTNVAASGANGDVTSITGITGAITATRANGTTVNDVLLIQNTTAASLGAQQISGAISQTGQGWPIGAGATQTARFRSYVVPIQGAGSTITATWNLASTIGAGSENIRLTITDAGNVAIVGSLSVGAPLRLKGYTVATLPSGTQGDTAFVTDSLAPTFLATVVGGGAIVTTVFYNGTNWVAQ